MPYQLLAVAFTQNGECIESRVFVILMTSIQITTSYTIFLTEIQDVFHVIEILMNTYTKAIRSSFNVFHYYFD